MGDTSGWSITPASNSNSDPTIGWAEGQAPSTVNDSARGMMAALAQRFLDEGGYNVTSAGTGSAYTLTLNQTPTAYHDGLSIVFKAHAVNGAAPTMNVASLGAKTIVYMDGSALPANVIPVSAATILKYSSSLGKFLLIGCPTIAQLNAILAGAAAADLTTFRTNAQTNTIGEIVMFGMSSAQTGFIICNGQAVSRSTFSNLFSSISTTYGVGDGSTTFNVPDFTSSVPLGITPQVKANLGASGSAFSATGVSFQIRYR